MIMPNTDTIDDRVVTTTEVKLIVRGFAYLSKDMMVKNIHGDLVIYERYDNQHFELKAAVPLSLEDMDSYNLDHTKN